MKEVCIPLSDFEEGQVAEVSVKIAGKQKKYEYRIESFPWEKEKNQLYDEFIAQSLKKIYQLKKHIEGYNNNWELLQIFTPQENAKYVQVLFRKRM